MSNWEARNLSSGQVRYAALDALVTGQVFRGLRLWHSAPSACAACHQLLGTELVHPQLSCLSEACLDKQFRNVTSLAQHARQTGHKLSVHTCAECGRLSPSL